MAMKQRAENNASGCPLEHLLRLLGRQWTPNILWTLSHHGPTRFAALRRELGGISAKVLTERLRELERAGVVDRAQAATVPPQVTYSLTERGTDLAQVLAGLEGVAARWYAHMNGSAEEA